MAKKKKQNALGIFFSFFLKAVVIILGLVILAMGAYLIRYALKEDNERKEEKKIQDSALSQVSDDALFETATDATGEDEDILFDTEGDQPADEASTEGETSLGLDAKLLVLNATETAGLAAAWKEKFTAAGYTDVQTGNYYGGPLDSSRIVVTEEGKGAELNSVLENVTIEYGNGEAIECDVSKEGVKAIIVIGNSNDIVSQ